VTARRAGGTVRAEGPNWREREGSWGGCSPTCSTTPSGTPVRRSRCRCGGTSRRREPGPCWPSPTTGTVCPRATAGGSSSGSYGWTPPAAATTAAPGSPSPGTSPRTARRNAHRPGRTDRRSAVRTPPAACPFGRPGPVVTFPPASRRLARTPPEGPQPRCRNAHVAPPRGRSGALRSHAPDAATPALRADDRGEDPSRAWGYPQRRCRGLPTLRVDSLRRRATARTTPRSRRPRGAAPRGRLIRRTDPRTAPAARAGAVRWASGPCRVPPWPRGTAGR
jgi:hypothetical protein